MPSWHPSQTSFNAGEISARMISRVGLETYQQAALRMRNYMPRLQGPAIRSPSTTYFRDITADGLVGRIIPFLTIDNRRSLLVLQDMALDIITGVEDPNAVRVLASAPDAPALPLQIVGNPEFDRVAGQSGEWFFTPKFFTGGEGDGLGCQYREFEYGGVLRCICRNWKYPRTDNESFLVTQEIDVPFPRDSVTFNYRIVYVANPGIESQDYTFTIKVGTSEGQSDVLDETVTGGIGTVTERTLSVALPGAPYTGPLFIELECTADDFGSTPAFDLDRFRAFIDAEPLPAEPPVTIDPTAVLYAEDDLQDVQFVQSPYGNKEVVLVHPLYPPQWLYYNPNTGEYVFEPMNFTNPPGVWAVDNYPSACTAYQGRLMLAATPDQSETIWGSRPGDWEDFSQDTYDEDDPPITGKPQVITPESAIELTTTYRSPIQWMYGHKDLMVGARDFEYLVSSETGLLQAGDIDVRLHSTHGSVNVQPASFGKFIAFAAERGTRARAMQRVFQDTGWVAPDLSVLADHLLSTGIRRMVRMRNPHQMLVCLLNSGTLAILHQDEYAEVYGWSTIDMTGSLQDICVLPLADGTDALLALVRQQINGESKLYIEAIFNWTYDRDWRYLSSSTLFRFDTPSNIISGLDYLEGERVQVIADNAFLGTYIVSGGQVELLQDTGEPLNVSSALVGMAITARLNLLPPVTDNFTGGVSSLKRYSNIIVRTLGSTRPIINGDRPADRDPATPMNVSQYLDLVRDNKVANLGTDPYQFITVEEQVPFKTEVLSVSGKLTSESL